MVLWRVEAASLLGQELVQVLKLLDEDAWDDANINALLARADSNGDAALQVVEFLNWILGPVWIKLSKRAQGHVEGRHVTRSQWGFPAGQRLRICGLVKVKACGQDGRRTKC